MSKFQVKHKSRGRYGLIDPEGQWLVDFLGTKEEAIAKADSLNANNNKQQAKTTVEKTTNKISSNSNNQKQFTLTEKGWLLQGEK